MSNTNFIKQAIYLHRYLNIQIAINDEEKKITLLFLCFIVDIFFKMILFDDVFTSLRQARAILSQW